MKEKASEAYIMEQVWSKCGGRSHGYQEWCRAVRVRGGTRPRRTGNTVRTHRSGCKHATALPVLRDLHIYQSQPAFFRRSLCTYYPFVHLDAVVTYVLPSVHLDPVVGKGIQMNLLDYLNLFS